MEKQNFNEYRIRKIKNKIFSLSEDIAKRRSQTKSRIADYRKKQRRFEEIREMEKEFREIAENCKAEWFGPKWIHPLKNVNTFNHIKYYCS